MSATYRLPDSLGGGECYATTTPTTLDGMFVIVPGVGGMIIQSDLLVEVKPELPPEPPVGSVVLVGAISADPGSGAVFRRYHGGWSAPGEDDEMCCDWAWVCALGDPVLLVPDPAAGAEPFGRFPDAGEAPLLGIKQLGSGGVRVYVADDQVGVTYVADLSREDAEAAARTLLAAARQP